MLRCGEEVVSEESEEESNGVNLMEFSDEILLHILSYVPCTDLVLNVRRTCRKLATLCLDKSLTHTVLLQKDYKVNKDKVKQLMRDIGKEIYQLNMAGCYWLPSSTIDHVTRCKNLVKLNLSGCHVTSLRLSKMLSTLQHLRSLAIDVNPGFDASQLSSECKATLSRVSELKQTLYTPSYGVVPCCTSLEKLLLYFEILDRSREGFMLSGQLMVGESNVPHYQNLRIFYARLAPGYVNQEVVRLYLAVLSDRTPEQRGAGSRVPRLPAGRGARQRALPPVLAAALRAAAPRAARAVRGVPRGARGHARHRGGHDGRGGIHLRDARLHLPARGLHHREPDEPRSRPRGTRGGRCAPRVARVVVMMMMVMMVVVVVVVMRSPALSGEGRGFPDCSGGAGFAVPRLAGCAFPAEFGALLPPGGFSARALRGELVASQRIKKQ